MIKTIRKLLLSAMSLLGAGVLSYHIGSQLNLKAVSAGDELWEQAPGDLWLYVGGLMMLIAGSLALAAFRLWRGGSGSR